MARITPTPGQKILYLLCIFLGVGILFVDYKTDNLNKIRHSYKSLVISTSYILKNYTIDLIRENFNQSKTKKALIKENESLKIVDAALNFEDLTPTKSAPVVVSPLNLDIYNIDSRCKLFK